MTEERALQNSSEDEKKIRDAGSADYGRSGNAETISFGLYDWHN